MTKHFTATRNRVLATLGLGLAMALAGCAPKAPSKLEHIIVQLPLYPQGPEAYLFLAEQKKMFEKAGLDVEILDGRGSNYAVQLLTSNHADIGTGTLTPLIFADQHGADAVAVAEFWPDIGPAVIAGKDSGITKPADLKGKRVAIASAGPWPSLLPSFLARFGLAESDLQLSYVDLNALFSTYASKQVDAILTVDTAITEAGPLRPSVLLRGEDYGIDLPGAGLFATKQTLAGPKRAAIARFLAVCVAALNYEYAGHEEEAADAVLALRPGAKLSKAKLRAQIDFYKTQFEQFKKVGGRLGAIDDEKWKRHIAFMKSVGMLKGDVNPKSFYTNDLLPSKN